MQALADFVVQTDYSTLPDAVAHKAKIHLLDTLGAALAGTRSAEFHAVKTIVRPVVENGARIWGADYTAAPRDAALLNGVAAHVFELDDTGGCDHSGAVVIPALFAALGQNGTIPNDAAVDGKAFLTAMVVGYEVARRILEAAGGYDTHNSAGWHSTATCGPLGAAASIANLWQFPAKSAQDAMTIATSFSSGLWAFIHDGSQTKKIHAGRAAEGGLLAAELAQAGLRGPSMVFEDQWGGFFRSFNHQHGDTACFTQELGQVWKINRVSLKPYASCRGTHSAIDALGDILQREQRDAASIRRIDCRLSSFLMEMCGQAGMDTLASTQMSLAYALAARAVFGHAELSAYTADRCSDPAIAEFLKRIHLDCDADMPAMDEPELTVTFDDGHQVTLMVPKASGSPDRPMSHDQIIGKFRSLAALALPQDQVDALQDAILNIEAITDMASIAELLKSAEIRMPLV
ncbi:MmgE/PrpD family protein [Paraburkholderia aspalathi]|nr:MmgE/PrpD family protein [Paraburkholderia aspalathi]